MTTFLSRGAVDQTIDEGQLRDLLINVFARLGARNRVLAIPPDFTRFHSQAGPITCLAREHFGDGLVDVLPALGTHHAMTAEQLDKMFPSLPHSLFRVHNWRDDVETVGEVSAEFVSRSTEGIYSLPWPAQLNRLVCHGGHDLILSIGQVVPHEVIGMANHNKNLFVGTGGVKGINESHYIGAVYGMERMMGRHDTPLRRILNEAERLFCQDLPVVYVLTVIGSDKHGRSVIRGLFVGDDGECFRQASELALQVNFQMLDVAPEKIVVFLEPDEFHSTWLGNKAIYRTRMAIADGGELIVLAPGVRTFGEDQQIDRLIRRFGYRTTQEVLQFVDEHDELRDNLSAAAHLIHGSPEDRFQVTYCPGGLTRDEIESAGYRYADLNSMMKKFSPTELNDGWNELAGGERIYFIRNPAQGLWATRDRFVTK